MTSENPWDDRQIDEELEETFPASDPPSHAADSGAQVAPPAVTDNRARNRFELQIDGQIAFLDYERRDGEVLLVHAEVPRALRGRGIGGKLVDGSLAIVNAAGLRPVPLCGFVAACMRGRDR
jgi:predicted GNAT family acetyltransferase